MGRGRAWGSDAGESPRWKSSGSGHLTGRVEREVLVWRQVLTEWQEAKVCGFKYCSEAGPGCDYQRFKKERETEKKNAGAFPPHFQ